MLLTPYMGQKCPMHDIEAVALSLEADSYYLRKGREHWIDWNRFDGHSNGNSVVAGWF